MTKPILGTLQAGRAEGLVVLLVSLPFGYLHQACLQQLVHMLEGPGYSRADWLIVGLEFFQNKSRYRDLTCLSCRLAYALQSLSDD